MTEVRPGPDTIENVYMWLKYSFALYEISSLNRSSCICLCNPKRWSNGHGQKLYFRFQLPVFQPCVFSMWDARFGTMIMEYEATPLFNATDGFSCHYWYGSEASIWLELPSLNNAQGLITNKGHRWDRWGRCSRTDTRPAKRICLVDDSISCLFGVIRRWNPFDASSMLLSGAWSGASCHEMPEWSSVLLWKYLPNWGTNPILLLSHICTWHCWCRCRIQIRGCIFFVIIAMCFSITSTYYQSKTALSRSWNLQRRELE